MITTVGLIHKYLSYCYTCWINSNIVVVGLVCIMQSLVTVLLYYELLFGVSSCFKLSASVRIREI